MKKIIIKYPDPVVTHDEVFTSRSTEPKMKEVTSKGEDIIDYRIEEAQLDSDGNIIPQVDPPFYKTTGRSIDWTIRVGETVEVPEYVGNYLVKIYPFLEIKEDGVSETTNPEEPKTAEAKSTEGNVHCKFCGQNFRNTRALALHISFKHPEKIL